MRRSTTSADDKPLDLMIRLKEKIIMLGGEIPEPWPWAITRTVMRKGKRRTEVDAALYNLQLLELKEDLEKQAVKNAAEHLSPAALENFKLHQEKNPV